MQTPCKRDDKFYFSVFNLWHCCTYVLSGTAILYPSIHQTRSSASSQFRPTSFISFWTWAHHLVLGLPVGLLPQGVYFLILMGEVCSLSNVAYEPNLTSPAKSESLHKWRTFLLFFIQYFLKSKKTIYRWIVPICTPMKLCRKTGRLFRLQSSQKVRDAHFSNWEQSVCHDKLFLLFPRLRGGGAETPSVFYSLSYGGTRGY